MFVCEYIYCLITQGGRVVLQKEFGPFEGFLPQGVVQSGNDLVITEARPEISGNYACTVFTPTGEIKEIIVINVQPSSK